MFLRRRRGRLRWAFLALLVFAVLNLVVFRLPSAPEPAGRVAAVGEGVELHYVAHRGSDSAPPVVFVHGNPGTWRDLEPVARRLGDRRWIAVDRPGFGDSRGGTLDLAGQIDALHRLLDDLAITGATIVGHSYGGAVALGLRQRHPRDVGAIVLVAAAAIPHEPDLDSKLNARSIQVVNAPVVEPVLDVFVTNLMLRLSVESQIGRAFEPDPVDGRYKHRVLAVSLKDDDLQAMRANLLGYADDVRPVERALGEIDVPVSVIQGRGDNEVDPADARAIARKIPGAKLVMTGNGHMIPITAPGIVEREIEAVERR